MNTKNAWVSLIGIITAIILGVGVWLIAKPTNEPVMLTIQAINRDQGSESEDYWTGSMQTVYYNGDAEYYEEYHLSGKKNKETWKIEDSMILNTQMLLNTIDFFTNETLSSGIEHRITYYDKDGNVLLEYYGSIEGNTFSRIVYALAK